MKYKSYPAELWDLIKNTTKELKQKNQPLIAAFDADGTLWDCDLGENLFKYTIDNGLVPLPESPWEHYFAMKKINSDPRSAYLWLAQIYKGLPLPQVQKWAEEAVRQLDPLPIFDDQLKLIKFLQSEGVKIYIVTASIKWAVIPGAKILGLTEANVLGVATKVIDNMITEEQDNIITYREGKPQALLDISSGIKPYLSVGNSEGDLNLLESSTLLRLAVSAAKDNDKLFQTESNLQTIAKSRNWLAHRFV
ncbi:MAG: haloacid dehalogenase-like hydrolase [Bdellovibrionales bacterium]|nr:haloacid dehalogenase-like hydrolase [Bdellovibrionales bacterium]